MAEEFEKRRPGFSWSRTRTTSPSPSTTSSPAKAMPATASPVVARPSTTSAQTHPDLVLLDVMLPEVSGYEIGANVRPRSRTFQT